MNLLKSIKSIFVDSREKCLRAGWRILIFVAVYAFLSRALSQLSIAVTGRLSRQEWDWWTARGVVVIISATLTVWLARRFLDKKSFVSLGLRINALALKDLIVGLGISLLLTVMMFGLLWAAGFLEITNIAWPSENIPAVLEIFIWFFAIGLAVGWSEEITFRGYLLQNMRDGMGLTWAIIISCLLYGLFHMSNPGSNWLSGTLIALIGFLRIYGWLRTNLLWLSIGMHAGWDFFQGPIFGLSVSGMKTKSLFANQIGGADWISGGSFGPESGILVLPVLALGFLLVFAYTRNRLKPD